MRHRLYEKKWSILGLLIVVALVTLGLLALAGPLPPAVGRIGLPETPPSLQRATPAPFATGPEATATRRRWGTPAPIPATPAPTHTLTPGPSPTPSTTPTPSITPTATPTPTPTLDLSRCNAAGCGSEAVFLPPAEFSPDLFLLERAAARRVCPDCPRNPQLSERELDRLVATDPATLARLRTLILSQQAYSLAPGVVYMAYKNVHHVVVDLEESGYVLRNIIPERVPRGTLITPSFCLSPQSLVVVNADYHGLNSSNKTETGRDLFFHLGRAALFELNGRYNLDVIRTRARYDRTSVSWGGGPIFIWNGRYDYNPEQEWFEKDDLEHYRATRWMKMTVAVSKDRKYLFISASYNLTLSQHAQNIIDLGQTWGIDVDRAMRFDGSESAYMALRLGDHLVPLFNLEEPLIVNCLAIERP